MIRIFIPNKDNAWIWSQFVIMILGIFLLNWKTVTVLIAFTYEGIIIGFIQFFKMQCVYWLGEKQKRVIKIEPKKNKLVFFHSFFFLFIYLLFCSVHLIFMFVFVEKEVPELINPIDLLHNTTIFFSDFEFQQAFFATLIGIVSYTMQNFVFQKKYHHFLVEHLITTSFFRIFLQQVLVIFSGYFFLSMGETTSVALFLLCSCFVVDILFSAAKQSITLRQKISTLLLTNQKKDMSSEEMEEYISALFDS
jgi:hypothetical protein